MKQSFCGKQRRQREWNDFPTSSYYTRSRSTVKLNFETKESQMTFLSSTIYPSALVIISLPTPTFHLACENIRFSSLFVAGDVSRGGKNPARQRRRARRNGCFIVCLPDFRHFSVLVVREVQPCTDCPVTSEISVKRDALFLLFNFRDSCVGPANYPPLIRQM